MRYSDRLHPWCIIRCLPDAQTIMVARFRRRHDAKDYLKRLRQLIPEGVFEIIFDMEIDVKIDRSPSPATDQLEHLK